jgi:hypothetical protein
VGGRFRNFALQGLDGVRVRHADLHAAWKRDGRPKEFDVGTELVADGATDAEVEEQKAQIEVIKKLLATRRQSNLATQAVSHRGATVRLLPMRYLFANLRRRRVDIRVLVNWSRRPDLNG